MNSCFTAALPLHSSPHIRHLEHCMNYQCTHHTPASSWHKAWLWHQVIFTDFSQDSGHSIGLSRSITRFWGCINLSETLQRCGRVVDALPRGWEMPALPFWASSDGEERQATTQVCRNKCCFIQTQAPSSHLSLCHQLTWLAPIPCWY